MTSVSRLSRGPRVLALLGCALGCVLGCTEPQSGIFAGQWCQVADPDLEVLDDLEDGDGIPCSRAGKWSVAGAGTLTPPVGDILRAEPLPAADMAARPSSFRALRLSGTVDADGFAKLVLALPNRDLSSYREIDFWARSEGSIEIRVAVVTPATAGDSFGVPVTVTGQAGGSPAFVDLRALTRSGDQPVNVAQDLVSCSAIEFQFPATSSPSAAPFELWIDDVQLKL